MNWQFDVWDILTSLGIVAAGARHSWRREVVKYRYYTLFSPDALYREARYAKETKCSLSPSTAGCRGCEMSKQP